MKVNVSIDDITPHPFSSTRVIEKCEDLLQTLRLMMDDAQKSYHNILKHDEIKFAPLSEDQNDWIEISMKDLKTFLNENE